MATTQSRSSGLFSGLVLISVGALLLLHNYGHLELGRFFTHWWPLLIIFWGAVKLYERTVGRYFGRADGHYYGLKYTPLPGDEDDEAPEEEEEDT